MPLDKVRCRSADSNDQVEWMRGVKSVKIVHEWGFRLFIIPSRTHKRVVLKVYRVLRPPIYF